MVQKPLVSIIIPTYNRKQVLIRLIESLKQSDYPEENMEIIVVDDASTDGTYDAVRKRFPEVKVVRNTRRKMTSGARNVGIRYSQGDYLFFVDHDNVMDRRAVSELVNFMERNEIVGLAGPMMYYYCEPKEIFCAGGSLRHPLYIPTCMSQHKKLETRQMANIRVIECDFIPNAFMTRKQVIKEIGPFDERNFPILWEDVDFAQRIKQRGYRIVIVPKAKVWHDVPTGKDFHIDKERSFFRGRNRARFYLKYAPLRNLMLPFDALGFCVVVCVYTKDSKRAEKVLQYFKGIIHGLVPKNAKNPFTEGNHENFPKNI
jgi:GT2 family glycosyltransferase